LILLNGYRKNVSTKKQEGLESEKLAGYIKGNRLQILRKDAAYAPQYEGVLWPKTQNREHR